MLSARGVRFEHHDLSVDDEAVEFLRANEIRAVPVIRVDDEIIIGFDEPRLKQVLGLVDTSAAHSSEWLASKYELVLDALARAVRQMGPAALDAPFEARRMLVRAHVLHIAAFAEGGCAAHESGTFGTEEMFAATARAEQFTDVDAVCSYVVKVRDDVATFLRQGAEASHERVVSSHYGGEVTIIELLRIMLRHSTHHLRQLYWYMENVLRVVPWAALTADDRAGITTPDELFDTVGPGQTSKS